MNERATPGDEMPGGRHGHPRTETSPDANVGAPGDLAASGTGHPRGLARRLASRPGGRPEEAQGAAAVAGMLGTTARMVVSKVVSGSAAAGLTVVTARALGPDGRGAFVLLFTLASLTYLVCTFGVNTAARVHLVASPRVVELPDYLGLTAALVLLQTVVCAALGSLLLPFVDVRLSTDSIVLLGLLGGSLLGQYMLFDALNAFGRTALAAGLDATGSVFQLAFVIGLAVLGAEDVALYIAALAVANLGQLALEVVALRSTGEDRRPRYRPERWRFLLRSGLPATALTLSHMLAFRLDRYLVGIFLTPAAVGTYSVAAAIPELLRIPAVALSYSLFYRIASGQAEPADFRSLRRLFLIFSTVAAAATFVIAPLLVPAVFGSSYDDAVRPLRILLLAEVAVTVFYVDAFSLAALDRIDRAAIAAAAGMAVVIVGNLVLIPALGISGAASATVLGYWVMGISALLLLKRHLSHRADVRGV